MFAQLVACRATSKRICCENIVCCEMFAQTHCTQPEKSMHGDRFMQQATRKWPPFAPFAMWFWPPFFVDPRRCQSHLLKWKRVNLCGTTDPDGDTWWSVSNWADNARSLNFVHELNKMAGLHKTDTKWRTCTKCDFILIGSLKVALRFVYILSSAVSACWFSEWPLSEMITNKQTHVCLKKRWFIQRAFQIFFSSFLIQFFLFIH